MGYTKREFLKIMGLGLVFMPFIGCFGSESNKEEGHIAKGTPDADGGNDNESVDVTDADVLMLTRNDEAYEKFNQGFNKRLHFLPKYIAICKTEKGIRFAIQKAAKDQLNIAVKSGGHSFEGFSGNNGGMVINLSQMKKITWLENNEVEVEPGCLLQDIQAAFFAKKRLLPAGSCGTVGIAGLTLGGGYGFFSRKYGLTCDNLLQLKMVAADGKVYSTDDDKELLWACMGGGNGNFGVITSFRFRTHDMPPVFDSYVLKFKSMNTERFKQTVDAWFGVSETLPQDGFAAYVLNGNTLTVLITNYNHHPDFNNVILPLTSIADSVSPTLQASLPKAMKRYYGRKGPIYFKNASAGLYKNKEDIIKVADKLFDTVIQNKGIVFQINTLGGMIADATFEQDSCYPHRRLPYLGELQAYWDNENQEARLVAAFESIQALFRESGITAHYRNYPDINFKDWETSYYGDNYTRLQKVKSKYDKDEMFQYTQSVKPV